MSIKQDLDNELKKRVSDKQKEFDLVKETYEEEMFEKFNNYFVDLVDGKL